MLIMMLLATRRGSVEITSRDVRTAAEDRKLLPSVYAEVAANNLNKPTINRHGKKTDINFSAVRVEKSGGPQRLPNRHQKTEERGNGPQIRH